jgi:hypothetical protein
VIPLAANETTIVIVVSALGGVVFVLTTTLVVLIFFAVFEGGEDSTNDVQHFIELTEEARLLLPNGHVLGDADAADSRTAIARFQEKKEEAREALWKSHRKRAA